MIIREAFEEYERSDEYNEYLDDHIGNVIRSWTEMLRPALEESHKFDSEELNEIEDQIKQHDKSKYDKEEYLPYLHHFYPEDHSEVKDDGEDPDFDYAWLRHQHLNPHHWQHWVLTRDSGETVPMDIPLKYVLEMLCDWHSFSAKYPTSTAADWYSKNKDKFILTDDTRKLVEKYVKHLEKPLSK